MKILALDTSSRYGSVALSEHGEMVLELTTRGILTQSETLTRFIERALSDVGWTIQDIEGFAVVNGPGSFTGIRVGLATVEGFAFATGRPAIAISSLKALALGVPGPVPVCPVLNARRGEVYTALYRWDGDRLQELGPERAVSPEQLARELTGEILVVGDGASLVMAALEAGACPVRATAPSGSTGLLRASVVGAWADQELSRDPGRLFPPLRPNYVRVGASDLGLRKSSAPLIPRAASRDEGRND